MTAPWKVYFWRNVTTSYARMAVRLLTGVLVFPLLFRYMAQEEFGFWSLLWGLLGYVVLVDFGMGFTATLEVARRHLNGEWDYLSRLISTMFWTYVMLFSTVEIALIIFEPQILDAIHVTGPYRESFGRAFIYFTLVLTVAFPLGIFYEVLRGLQRLDVVNVLNTGSHVLSFLVLCAGVVWKWPFDVMVLVGAMSSLSSYVVAYFVVRRLVPQLSLSPRLFSIRRLRPVLSFSLISYLLTIANLVIARSDQLVISVTLGVSMVAIYQVGFKLADVYTVVSSQITLSLSQAAAHCKSSDQRAELVDLLVKTSRLTMLVAVPGLALALVYMDPIIRLLTGIEDVPRIYHVIAWVLLLGRLSYLLTHACACPVFLGGGFEKPLLRLTLTEAVANLVISVVLAWHIGLVGVALGTVVPMMVTGWLWAVPLTLKFTGFRFLEWMGQIFGPIAMPLTQALLILAFASLVWPVSAGFPIWKALLVGLAVMAPVGLNVAGNIRRGFWEVQEAAPAAETA